MVTVESRARLRFAGSDSVIAVIARIAIEMDRTFRMLHRRQFGYSDDTAPIIVEALSVEASGMRAASAKRGRTHPCAGEAEGGWRTVERASLSLGESVAGPVLVIDPASTTVVERGMGGSAGRGRQPGPDARAALARRPRGGTEADPVRLEIFNNLFMAIAEEMGVVLQSTATSVNIKERLDFSCALFDAGGELIANAPHIPVHLGSMGDSIARVIESAATRDGRGFRRGDAYVLNDPYRGGTHLPDITVIVPVFYSENGNEPDAFVAARGHHSDMGGIAPGSMPPESRTIEEEGVLIDNRCWSTRAASRNRDPRAAGLRALPRTQPRSQHLRPSRTACRVHARDGAAAWRGTRSGRGCRQCLYGACAGQCRRERARAARPA